VDGSFGITTSPQNQRIESYWATLQKDKIGWWKRFFRDMTDNDLLDTSDPVLLDCLRYCFMGIVRKDLESVKSDWNNHIISKSRNGGPSGRPNCMFFLPHLYNVDNFLVETDEEEIDAFTPVVNHNARDYSEEFVEFADYFLHEDEDPNTPEEALNRYIFLLEKIVACSS